MTSIDPRGSDWSDDEIDLIVADYFEMLRLELSGQHFVKAHRNEQLRRRIRRSHASIEFKHCNISAVMERLGRPSIAGYKPRHNFQNALIDGIGRYLSGRSELVGVKPILLRVAEEGSVFLEPPPALSNLPTTPALERLVAKFDPAERDARDRALGRAGEERILIFERNRLASRDRHDLASRVRWVAEEDGAGAGYDIRSFTESGAERLIEVKTTTGNRTTPFHLTENERAFSAERPDSFRLIRLFDFARSARAFELQPPLEAFVRLSPTAYRASF
jgi:hypothetical protein